MTTMVLYGASVAGFLFGDGTPSPTPSPGEVLRPGLSKWDVTPGLAGFLAIFVVALAGVAVWFSMNKKLRKIQYDERLAQEARDARAADTAQELRDATALATAGEGEGADAGSPEPTSESAPDTGPGSESNGVADPQ